jgi:hypothetical protein
VNGRERNAARCGALGCANALAFARRPIVVAVAFGRTARVRALATPPAARVRADDGSRD